MTNEPLVNHWWNVPLYVTARGLTTSLMPHPTGPSFQIDFDFEAHRLEVSTVDGGHRALDLEPRTVADFYGAVMALLDELDVPTAIWPMPVEIAGAVPFPDDRVHAAYDPDAGAPLLAGARGDDRVFTMFRSRFVGKASPTHLFWGALDLASTRFSGRTAPAAPRRRAELRPAA